MTLQSKREYLARIKDRYRHAGKKGKTRILNEFCEVCGYERKHAIKLLNKDGRKKKKKPGRPSKYGAEEIQVLKELWLASGRLCSSRLVGVIALWLPHYEKRYGHLEESVRQKVLNAKARTLDRVLRPVRKKYGSRGLSGTRPGNYLKNSIPIKISHSDVNEPGYMQADTVAHCGGSLEGDFAWSLTFTDIKTGWTANGAVWNKGEYGVHKLLERMEEELPFALKGFHSDNGGEFINHHLESYYRKRENPIEMTRGRSGQKNDNPHVEQKNYTHVRCLLGYQRIEDESLVALMNQLYEASNLLENFFCATRKLIFKERRGSKYYKKYDQAATPCDRVLADPTTSKLHKTWLTEVKTNLDPFELRRIIDNKQDEIFRRLRCH
jgi:transposase InsO family protein